MRRPIRPRSRRIAVAVYLTLALAAVGCGNGENSTTTTPSSPAPETRVAAETSTGSTNPPVAPTDAPTTSSPPATDLPTTPIVYQSGGRVRTVMPDGSDSTVVAPDVEAGQEHPDWSPDGSSVLFEIGFDKLWTVNVDGSDATVVYECVEPCTSMQDGAWSPDGTEIAFMVAETTDGATTSRSAILVLDVATGDTRTAYEDTSGMVWLFTPRWSPDGSAIVMEAADFGSTALSATEIFTTSVIVAPTDGSEATEIVTWDEKPGDARGAAPDWSPTGDLIVFSRFHNLYTVTPTGDDETAVTDFNGDTEHAIQPTFTPDGTQIVFTYVHGRFGVDDVPRAAIIDTDGAGFTVLAEEVLVTHPRFRP